MDLYKKLGHNLIIKKNDTYICINCGMEVIVRIFDEFVFANGEYYEFNTPKCSEIILESIIK